MSDDVERAQQLERWLVLLFLFSNPMGREPLPRNSKQRVSKRVSKGLIRQMCGDFNPEHWRVSVVESGKDYTLTLESRTRGTDATG